MPAYMIMQAYGSGKLENQIYTFQKIPATYHFQFKLIFGVLANKIQCIKPCCNNGFNPLKTAKIIL